MLNKIRSVTSISLALLCIAPSMGHAAEKAERIANLEEHATSLEKFIMGSIATLAITQKGEFICLGECVKQEGKHKKSHYFVKKGESQEELIERMRAKEVKICGTDDVYVACWPKQ